MVKENILSKCLKILVACFFVLGVGVSSVFAQANINMSSTFLTNELIVEVNVDREEFLTYCKHAAECIVETLKDNKENGDIIIHFTLHPDKASTINIYSKPAAFTHHMPQLLRQIQTIGTPRTFYTDLSWLCTITVNHGSLNKDELFIPPFIDPIENAQKLFNSLSLEDKKAQIQKWAKNEVIPILGIYASRVEPKYSGVKAVGMLLTTFDVNDFPDVFLLTDNNSNYWKAVLEMSRGNFLIPVSKIFMHVANGDLDIANRYHEVYRWFADDRPLATHYLDELAWRFKIFYEEYYQHLNHGLVLHDQGKYQEAVDLYTKLLTVYPKSAFANYELYFTQRTQRLLKKDDESDDTYDWKNVKNFLYACDPLFPMDIQASTGREAYLLFRRREITSLFKEQANFIHAVIKYADIALDLEAYGFSAELYWLILSYFSSEDYGQRNILAHFLFCLERLGDTTTKTCFQGEFEEAFQYIDAERKELMKNSDIYKSFTIQD